MVLGLGIDIIEIDRIKQSVDNYGDRFLEKIFTISELEYCLSKKNKYQHLAARFAAKEAITKALSSVNVSPGWKDIEISNLSNGRPVVNLRSIEIKEYLGNDKKLLISMSHSDHYVTCVAILSTTA
ncbi:holo-acyl-carrier-protein synthase [Melioribacter roseus P3M-2]|uniref:Holo-[acyl-carrier-protein] synthase n=1 Tax=Melioribacter roseus (strain DSM 23840 / JCM 17771 / VKM B-2668 / P3M-2) TaxID=1191523 RepID=I6YYX9_MELRP|nr:holo-ACP synthase [Melioribacter roseus]AFN75787.1 holo-acyl-carrier-protein synthase [Melioribacter roseus P3M-2]